MFFGSTYKGKSFAHIVNMKKNLLLFFVVFAVLLSCNNNKGSGEGGGGDEAETDAKKVTSRDLSITPQNSYNDLFIDSTKVAAFLDSAELKGKYKRRILSFYNARNYQYAWFAKDGLTEQARGFYNLYLFDATHKSDSLQVDKKLKAKMDALFAEEDLEVTNSNASLLQTELALTKLFIVHGLQVYEDGYVKRKEMERFIPSRKVNAIGVSDSLISKKHKDNKYFEDINEPYKKLKVELQKYVAIAKRGAWPTIELTEKAAKMGNSSSEILALKTRLQLMGDMPLGDTTPVYNEALDAGIKSFQTRLGFSPSGKVTASLLTELNVPVENRIEQLLINLDRMRWMPSLPEGKMILVNIPEFTLHVMEGKSKVFDMNVVVGKQGFNTMMFTNELSQVVFSPYWNVPASIVEDELLAKMAANPNYLASQNMEIVSSGGKLPIIRQLPGADNALGKVKFLFPNSFNIYFHDSPAKSLFKNDKRAYSHGCIRLSDPDKMANYLLKDQQEWSADAINMAMNAETEKIVVLKKAVPVFITYYTAWVDANGKLNFRDDIYGHDKAIASKLFAKN